MSFFEIGAQAKQIKDCLLAPAKLTNANSKAVEFFLESECIERKLRRPSFSVQFNACIEVFSVDKYAVHFKEYNLILSRRLLQL